MANSNERICLNGNKIQSLAPLQSIHRKPVNLQEKSLEGEDENQNTSVKRKSNAKVSSTAKYKKTCKNIILKIVV